MVNKRRLLVSPIDTDLAPIVRYRDMIDRYSIHGVVSPSGWGYTGSDTSFIDGGFDTGICVDDDFEKQLKHCDSVLLNWNNEEKKIPDFIVSQMETAAIERKKILISAQTGAKDLKSIEELINNGADIELLYSQRRIDEKENNIHQELYKINTPVIMVAGLGERCNKFETQLVLRKYFTGNGYKVCQIGTKGYNSIFGMEPIPYFLTSDRYSCEDKVYLLNHYIKDLEEEHKPDVFIIGIPGGIMPFDSFATNRFAMTAYIISNALTPDSVVLNIYYNSFTNEYFSEIQKYCKYKFNFHITCFNVANTMYTIDIEDKENYIKFLSLDSQYVVSHIAEEMKTNWNVYHVFSGNNEIPESVANQLAENVNVIRCL